MPQLVQRPDSSDDTISNSLSGVTTRKAPLAIIDQGLVSGCNFVTSVLIGRCSGMEELGVYAIGFTLLILVQTVHESLNLAPYTVMWSRIEGLARAQYAGSTLVQFFLFCCLSAVGLALAGLGAAAWGGHSQMAYLLLTVAAITPMALLREFARRFALAHLDVRSSLRVDMLAAVIQIAALAWLASIGMLSALTALVTVGIACGVSGSVWLLANRGRFVLCRAQIIRGVRRNFAFGRWAVGARFLQVARAYLVPWLLLVMLDATATGGYAAAMTIVGAFNPFLMGIGALLAPWTALARSQGGEAELRRVVWKVTLILSAATLLFCVLLVQFSETILILTYGPDFSPLASTVAALSIALLVSIVGMGADNGLRAMERPDVDFRANAIGLGATALATILLTDHLGPLAGAIGMFLGGCLITLIRCAAFALMSRLDDQVRNRRIR